jgi:hypothetical protein
MKEERYEGKKMKTSKLGSFADKKKLENKNQEKDKVFEMVRQRFYGKTKCMRKDKEFEERLTAQK